MFPKRNRLGQFATPPWIAEFMVRWACRGGKVGSFLDPAAGTGLFMRRYLDLPGARKSRIVGYEIDPALRNAAPRLFLRGRDYLRAPAGFFDAIVCNPPYLRRRSRLNSYCLFLLKSLRELSPGGRCAYLIPAEFLNSNFGVSVKRRLIESGRLRAVICFDHRIPVFQDALTTAAVILCENSPSPGLAHFMWIKESGVVRRRIPLGDLDPALKWQNEELSASDRPADGLVPLSTYGRCLRGVATGANAFFTLNARELKRHGLSPLQVRPCVTKASHARGPSFTKEDFKKLRDSGKKCFLLDLRGTLDRRARRYLELGKSLGVHLRYLPAHRFPWYSREKKKPADLWIPVFFRDTWKVVKNEARLLQLTPYHGFYLNALGKKHARRVLAYLNSRPGRAALDAPARRYGGGLRKLEPRDAGKILVPDFERRYSKASAALLKAA